MSRLSLLFLLIALSVFVQADQLDCEGIIPVDVDKSAMTAEYYRLWHILAPHKRPASQPVRIVFTVEKDAGSKQFGLPEWGEGGAIGRDLIVVPTAFKPFLDQSFAQITRHELAHIVLARAYPSTSLPRWLHEGIAMTLSGEMSMQQHVVISKAIFTNSIMPLSSIDSVNGFFRGRADIAYCESQLAVVFLIEHYGMDVLEELCVSSQKSGGFSAGLYATLGLTQREFEAMLQSSINERYRFVFLITDYYAFWIAVVILFIIAFFVAHSRKRKRMQEAEASEQKELLEKNKDLAIDDNSDEDDSDVLSDEIVLEDDEEEENKDFSEK
jgi:hypothetical protein